jgi:hypothetical protein
MPDVISGVGIFCHKTTIFWGFCRLCGIDIVDWQGFDAATPPVL